MGRDFVAAQPTASAVFVRGGEYVQGAVRKYSMELMAIQVLLLFTMQMVPEGHHMVVASGLADRPSLS